MISKEVLWVYHRNDWIQTPRVAIRTIRSNGWSLSQTANNFEWKRNSPTVVRGAYCSFWTPSALQCKRFVRSNEGKSGRCVRQDALARYSLNLPETVIKCWPLGDPWACTTATCAVTCWPFWFWPFCDVVSDSATKICESLESTSDSKGTTSITLTLPEGAVWRIIFFCSQESNYATFSTHSP